MLPARRIRATLAFDPEEAKEAFQDWVGLHVRGFDPTATVVLSGVDLTITVFSVRDDETIEEFTRRADDIIEVITRMPGVRYADAPALESPSASSD